MQNTQKTSADGVHAKRPNFFKRTFPLDKWADLDRVRGWGYLLIGMFKRLFVINQNPEVQNQESFKDAMKRLKLTDAMLASRQKNLMRLYFIFVFFGACLLGYDIFLWTHARWMAGMLALSVTVLAFAFAFRYHFWHFQIRERKLGCTVREWYRYGLLGEKR